MDKRHLDFESRSDLDITKVGAWAYASHPSTDITVVRWAINDEPVQGVYGWDLRKGAKPPTLVDFAGRTVAHSVEFEYAMWHFVMHKKYGFPDLLDPAGWDCTKARAYMCGLPGTLEGMALSLRLKFQKDMEGKKAMYATCRRKKDGTWNEDPLTMATLYRYCGTDVETERAGDKALPELPDAERKLFELDLRINRRGLLIDLGAARAATEISAALADDLNAKLKKITGGACSKASGVTEMKRWIAAQGVEIPTVVKVDKETGEEVTKETLDIEAVKDLLKTDLPPVVAKALKIRQQVGKSSVAKFKKMLEVACADGRARGMFQYHGAHTGRWAARLFQPANLPQGFGGDDVEALQEFALSVLGMGAGFFQATFGDKAMQTLSDLIRAVIIPAPGKIYVGADLNAIECRVLNWLAGEQWVLDLFARGDSPYLRMAEMIFEKKGLTKKGDLYEYGIGKRTELGFGFGMGAPKFQASTYTETSKQGEGVWLDDELCERAKAIYRETHPKVVEFWYATEAAAINAVKNPGQIFATAEGRVLWSMSADRRFLICKLPSGRLLRYYTPSVKVTTRTFCKNQQCPHVLKNNVELCPKKRAKEELRYWTQAGEGAIQTGCNGFLGEYRTWGGELVENVVQAAARDFMVVGLRRAEENGLPLVLHNYDELLAEVSLTGTIALALTTMIKMMTEDLPAWTAGCPVKAEGFIGRRYRK